MMPHLQGHLSLLWDHLVRRALATENEPSARIQHLLDDLDLLLVSASDLVKGCLDRSDSTVAFLRQIQTSATILCPS